MTISEARRIALLVLALLAAVAWAPAAAAETDEQRAVALFDKGRKLAREGRCGDAVPILLESIRYAEGVGALLNLGNCYESLGKTASALRSFLRARELAASKSDPRSDEAAARARTLEREVPTLTIHVAPRVREGRETVVKVDGELWPRERWDTPVPIDPGAHAIELTAREGDRTPRDTHPVTVARAEHAEIDLAPPSEPPRPTHQVEPATSAARRDEAKPETGGGTQRTLSFVVGGAGAAGLVVGAILGVLSLTTHASIVGRCPSYPTCSTTDQAALAPLNDRASAEGTVSTVAIASGAALLAGGLALFLTAPGR
jgi:hypothetical protein